MLNINQRGVGTSHFDTSNTQENNLSFENIKQFQSVIDTVLYQKTDLERLSQEFSAKFGSNIKSTTDKTLLKNQQAWISARCNQLNINAVVSPDDIVRAGLPAHTHPEIQIGLARLQPSRIISLLKIKAEQGTNFDFLRLHSHILSECQERAGSKSFDAPSIATLAADMIVKDQRYSDSSRALNVKNRDTIDLLGGQSNQIKKVEITSLSSIFNRGYFIGAGGGADCAVAASLAAQFHGSAGTSIQPVKSLSNESVYKLIDNGSFGRSISAVSGLGIQKPHKPVYPNPDKEAVIASIQGKPLVLHEVKASVSGECWDRNDIDIAISTKPHDQDPKYFSEIRKAYSEFKSNIVLSKSSSLILCDTGGDITMEGKWGRDQMMQTFALQASKELSLPVYLYVQSPGVDQEESASDVIAQMSEKSTVYQTQVTNGDLSTKPSNNIESTCRQFAQRLDQPTGTLTMVFNNLHKSEIPTAHTLLSNFSNDSTLFEQSRNFVTDKRGFEPVSKEILYSAFIQKID